MDSAARARHILSGSGRGPPSRRRELPPLSAATKNFLATIPFNCLPLHICCPSWGPFDPIGIVLVDCKSAGRALDLQRLAELPFSKQIDIFHVGLGLRPAHATERVSAMEGPGNQALHG
jgi:hypothetical protein